MSFNFRTEEYYKKFIELQEKLRKSEEERLKLEMKFNEMLRVTREEEQMHYRKLRSQYKRFLEEDRRRQDRNDRILRTLERIENRVAMLMAKTERFKLLRQQYQMLLDRICKMDQVKTPEVSSVPKETQYESPSQPVEEQGDVVKNYLQNVSSQRLRNLVHNTEETGPRLPFPIKADVRDDDFYNFSESENRPNYASSIAEDIMSSIQSRYYNKPIKDMRTRELNNNLQPNKSELTKPKYEGDNEITPYPRGFGKSFLEKASADSDTEDLSEPQNSYYSRTSKDELLPKKSKDNVDLSHSISDIYLNNNYQETDKNVITAPQDNKEEAMINEKDNRGSHYHQENQIDDTVRLIEDNKKIDSDENHPEHVISKPIEKKLEEKQLSFQKEEDTRPFDYEDYEEKEIEKPAYREQSNVESGHRLEPPKEEFVNKQYFEETSVIEQPIMEPLEEIRPEPEKPEKKCEPLSLPHLEEKPAEAPSRTHDEDIPPMSSYISDQKPVDTNEDTQQYSDHQEIPQPEEQQFLQEYVEPHQPVASGEYYENPARQPQANFDNQNLAQNNQDLNPELYQHQYDEDDQLIQQYDENGQPLHVQQYDDQGQYVQQYDETGQPILQYDETGQPLQQYDQTQYDEHGQPIQQYEGQYLQQYDENGQPYPQYDDQGQYLQQYDDQGQFLQQYDENGQLIPQFDEHGQLLQQYGGGDQQYQQFDDSGQMMQQYDMGAEQEMVQGSEEIDQPQAYSEPEEPKEEELGIKEEMSDKVAKQELVKETGIEENEDVVAKKPSNVMEMLDTDTESAKQETKVSNDSDFDFSNS